MKTEKPTAAAKTIALILLLMSFSFLLVNCKKNKKDDPDEPVTPPAPVWEGISAKVDGAPWITGELLGSPTISLSEFNSGSGAVYSIYGYTGYKKPYTTISFSFPYGIGNYTLGVFYKARYDDSEGNSYSAKSGTLTITEMDTSGIKSSIMDKFKATFSFKTDTVNGKSFSITDGVINYIAD